MSKDNWDNKHRKPIYKKGQIANQESNNNTMDIKTRSSMEWGQEPHNSIDSVTEKHEDKMLDTPRQDSGQGNNSGLLKNIKDGIENILNWINNRGNKCALQSDVNKIDNSVQQLDTGLQESLNFIGQKIDKRPKGEDFPKVLKPTYDEVMKIKSELTKVSSRTTAMIGKVEDERGSVIEAVRSLIQSQRNAKGDLDGRMDGVETSLKTIGESVETMQSLPGKIDEIHNILTDKGISLKQELPTVNHEEETIVDLAECGEKIFQQLTLAARWYARKLPELNAHETTMKNLHAANDQAKEQAHQNGIEEGRKMVIRDLLNRYDEESLDKLLNPADLQLKVLADFLTNAGVEPMYEMHQEITLSEKDRLKYEPYIKDFTPGKIVITFPGYTFDSQIIAKARYMPYEEFQQGQGTMVNEPVTQLAKNTSEEKPLPNELTIENSASAKNVTENAEEG